MPINAKGDIEDLREDIHIDLVGTEDRINANTDAKIESAEDRINANTDQKIRESEERIKREIINTLTTLIQNSIDKLAEKQAEQEQRIKVLEAQR